MVIPKYDIGQVVFIYSEGKLIEQVISRCRIIISDKNTKVGYQFCTDKEDMFACLLRDYWLDEKELFFSIDHFVKINS